MRTYLLTLNGCDVSVNARNYQRAIYAVVLRGIRSGTRFAKLDTVRVAFAHNGRVVYSGPISRAFVAYDA